MPSIDRILSPKGTRLRDCCDRSRCLGAFDLSLRGATRRLEKRPAPDLTPFSVDMTVSQTIGRDVAYYVSSGIRYDTRLMFSWSDRRAASLPWSVNGR